MTQEELAQKLGLQKSAIAKYESGRVQNIKRTMISRLADVLECDPVWLMDLEAKTHPAEQDATRRERLKRFYEKLRLLSDGRLSTMEIMLEAFLSEERKERDEESQRRLYAKEKER